MRLREKKKKYKVSKAVLGMSGEIPSTYPSWGAFDSGELGGETSSVADPAER